jgi:hypothetical protein
MPKRIFCGILIFDSVLFSQSVIVSGYTAPAPVAVAPGQIATFYVQFPSGAVEPHGEHRRAVMFDGAGIGSTWVAGSPATGPWPG